MTQETTMYYGFLVSENAVFEHLEDLKFKIFFPEPTMVAARKESLIFNVSVYFFNSQAHVCWKDI